MARAALIAEIHASDRNEVAGTSLPLLSAHRSGSASCSTGGAGQQPQDTVGNAASSESQFKETDFVQVKVELLSGAAVLEQLKVPLSISISNLKMEVEQREGTPVQQQQLIFDCNILEDRSTLKELGCGREVTLSLIRKAFLQFIWDVSSHFAIGTPHVIESSDFQVGKENQFVTMQYYPRGDRDNVLCKQGMCSLYVTRPKSSVLRCRVSIGAQSRESLFNSAMGQTGWVNFCEQPEEHPRSLVLDVMHLGIVQPPVVDGESASWDLRSALGGMPFAVGQQFKSPIVTLGEAQLVLVFFPGGKSNAPAYHTSLWVMPIQNLFDRQYRCVVDGHVESGSGDSLFHFPRPEQFGNVQILLLEEGSRSSGQRAAPYRPLPAEEPQV